MHFMDAHRRVPPIVAGALLHPGLVGPGKGFGLGDDGGRPWPELEALAVGVGLQEHLPGVPVAQLEFVQRARLEVGQEQLPHPEAGPDPHGMAAPVPGVEVADHAHPVRIGRPDGEQHPRHVVHFVPVGAEEAVGMPVLPLAEQVQVEIRKLRGVAVRIVDDVLAVLAVAPDQPVVRRQVGPLAAPLEQVAGPHPFQPEVALEDGYLAGLGNEGPDHRLPVLKMMSQDGEGVVVAGFDQLAQVFVERSCFLHGGSPFPGLTR